MGVEFCRHFDFLLNLFKFVIYHSGGEDYAYDISIYLLTVIESGEYLIIIIIKSIYFPHILWTS